MREMGRDGGRSWLLVGVLMTAAVCAQAQGSVALTTVADTVYSANGAAAQGSVVVSWSAFTTAGGAAVAAGSTAATLSATGGLQVALAPNTGAVPTGSYYTAVFHLSDGTTSRQYWVVPVSGTAVKLSAVENQVLPTAVAMQTVSKSYVDQAIAAAVQSGVTPTGAAATGGSSSSVQKAGDTMTGPLVLSGDPTSALQAADKHYVDAGLAAAGGGASTKVSMMPNGAQTVVQPAGTQMEVNSLNGVLDASGFLTGNGNNGLINAAASGGCASGCEISVNPTYVGNDSVPGGHAVQGLHVTDRRGGAVVEFTQDPLPAAGPTSVGHVIAQTTTRTAQQSFATRPSVGSNNLVMSLTHNVLAGGSNQFPADTEAVPYNKSNYSVMELIGNYNTQGQHVQFGNDVFCMSVGDCLAGAQMIRSMGGYRDLADEGTHPFDLQVAEDDRVFQGTCGTGCATGATTVKVNATANGGTQGDGRFLMDKTAGKVISTGSITGASGDLLPIVVFSGTSFPVSTQLVTAAAATSQAGNLAPGTVTLPIATSGVPSGYATSTAALPGSTGVACMADQGTFPNFETASYTVVDGSHVRLTLNKVHKSGAVLAVGGLCGYGLEQKVDTMGAVKQVFPVVGSPSATTLYYAPALTAVAGVSGGVSTGGFLTASATIASATRSGNVVTLNLAQSLPYDMTGLAMSVGGVSDASYNGSFAVTSTGPATLTYPDNGADGASAGGTVSFANGSFALYPMAEVLSVYSAAAGGVDGTFTLAANTVTWAAGDAVEEPHYHQQLTYGDTEFITQYVPRPTQYGFEGKQFQGQLGPGSHGWAITNAVPETNYIGGGGTHQVPDSAYVAAGPWRNAVEAEAGSDSLLRVHCNLHGCSRWDSTYALFSLDRNGGVQDFLFYSPQNSTASWLLGGQTFSFSPGGFSAPSVQTNSVTAASMKTGYNGNAQIASGGSSGYSNFTLNGNNNDGGRLGFIGGGTGDPSLYLDVPVGGQFLFRFGSTASSSSLSNSGFSTPRVVTAKVASGTGGNTDLVGVLVVGGGSTSSNGYGFTGGYGTAPVCTVQPQNATPAAVQALNGYVPQVSAGGLSVAVGTAPAASVTFGYLCVARN